jgi:hypothetical protein
VDGKRSAPERDLRVGAVDAGHAGVAHERGCAGRRELVEPRERARLDVHGGCGQDGGFDVANPRVGRLLVDRRALLEEHAEVELVLRERPVRAAHAAPGVLDVDVDMERERVLAERVPDLRRAECASAEREHGRGTLPQALDREPRLLRPEEGLALAEELGNAHPRQRLELAVDVDERTPEPPREVRAERRLARAHEAHERDVLV